MTEESVLQALRGVKYPGYNRDIVSFGIVKNIAIRGDSVTVAIQLAPGNPQIPQQIKAEAERAIKQIPGVNQVQIQISASAPAATQAFGQQNKVPGLNRVVAIASGKGGVGKSTVSVNLACALSQLGASVGLLDCDIYGPSIPLMMGVHQKPNVTENDKLIPLTNYGVKLMSMGFLIDADAPVIWRGPMIMKTIQQFISDVDWGTLDYLLVDLPPGTGDAQLSLCQTVPLDGGVIVTTPQEASLGVVRKGIAMFEKVNVPILGIVENMSYYMAPGGERVEIFGHGGGQAEAKRRNVSFLGEIPIIVAIREGGDAGKPVAAVASESVAGKAFINIAESLRQKLP